MAFWLGRDSSERGRSRHRKPHVRESSQQPDLGAASLGLGLWLPQRLGVNGLWEAGDPAVHLRVWGTEVLTWELPYLSQGALKTGFPGSFSQWEHPPPHRRRAAPGPAVGDACWALSTGSLACRRDCRGPLLPRVASVGDLGPPPAFGAGPVGAPQDHVPRGSRISWLL